MTSKLSFVILFVLMLVGKAQASNQNNVPENPDVVAQPVLVDLTTPGTLPDVGGSRRPAMNETESWCNSKCIIASLCTFVIGATGIYFNWQAITDIFSGKIVQLFGVETTTIAVTESSDSSTLIITLVVVGLLLEVAIAAFFWWQRRPGQATGEKKKEGGKSKKKSQNGGLKSLLKTTASSTGPHTFKSSKVSPDSNASPSMGALKNSKTQPTLTSSPKGSKIVKVSTEPKTSPSSMGTAKKSNAAQTLASAANDSKTVKPSKSSTGFMAPKAAASATVFLKASMNSQPKK